LEREGRDLEGRVYSVRIRPYRTHENRIDGAVILLIDTEELRRTLEAMVDVVAQPLLTLGPDMVIRYVNDAFSTTFGLGREDLVDRNLFEVADHQWDVPELRNMLENTLVKTKFVRSFPVEINFKTIGWRKMLVSARRLPELGQGRESICLSLVEAPEESK
jgi:two-component system, chemotaxis family, CheB/CheR fusion protein